jgi:hypothetical protein
MAQNLRNTIFVGIADEKAARLSPDFAEPLAALAYRGRVDERQQLFHVAHDQCIEKRFVDVLEIT